jgi:TolB-like protein/tetratricopeptide (TPR) repeat protein/tRNA A-37 threonylcarbamoyl transferase component Bud32
VTTELTLPGYEVGESIGKGGMATVYRAHDLRHDRTVAIKVLNPDIAARLGAERFHREIRITAGLQHPNILPVFDSGESGGLLWYAMPFAEGSSLRERMDSEGRMTVGESLRIVREVADALEHAHAMGVIHRDIKPENILISRGHALVADFGIARRPEEGAGMTQQGFVVGTPAYMSPEQALGESGVDRRSDIYALGCVLFEMLSGIVPHGERGSDRILVRRITDPAPSLGAFCPVPQAVDDALTRALAPSAEDRFDSATEFVTALERPDEPNATGAVSAAVRSVAVLPFGSLTADAECELFGDGLTDEVITSLSGLRRLRVTSRPSVMRLKGDRRAAPAIARELGVQYLLSGTVRRAGSKIRISVQLVDARLDAQLWAERFDGVLDDVFAIQERIAAAAVEALAIRLTGSEARHVHNRPIEDIRAWECYVRGRHEAWGMTSESLERAEQLARTGLTLAGPTVELLFLQGMIAIIRNEAGLGGEEQLVMAEQSARQIFELSPGAHRGHAMQGTVEWKRGRVQEAVRHLKRALAGDPANAEALLVLANAYLVSGCTKEAAPLIERLAELDPLSPLSQCMPGWLAALEGRLDDALQPYFRMMELAPSNPMGQMFYGWALGWAGRTKEAIEQLGTITHPVFGAFCRFSRYALQQDVEAARAAFTPEMAVAATQVEFLARQAGEAFALIGDTERAVQWLRSSTELGFINFPFLAEHDRNLERIRETPEFQSYLAEVKERWLAFEA